MLKRLSLVGTFFIFCSAAHAQKAVTKATVAAGAVFSLTNSDTVFNFVEIEEGDVVKHEFLFTNTGSEPLIISNIHSNLQNAKFRWPNRFIKPGKTGIITVTYRSFMDVGDVAGDVSVTSNATQEPTTYLHIKGKVTEYEEDKPCCDKHASK